MCSVSRSTLQGAHRHRLLAHVDVYESGQLAQRVELVDLLEDPDAHHPPIEAQEGGRHIAPVLTALLPAPERQ